MEADAAEVVRNYAFPRMVCRVQTRGEVLSVPEDIKMVNEAARKSDAYQKMIKAVRGEWDMKDPAVQEIKARGDFSINDSQGEALVYKGNLLVPPPEIRAELLHLAHDAHQGDNAMWLTCRQILWWPVILLLNHDFGFSVS